MFVGSFEPDDFDQFQSDVVATTAAFKAAGVTQLLIDLTNNGGEYIAYYSLLEVSNALDLRWFRVLGSVPASVPRGLTDWIPVRFFAVFSFQTPCSYFF